MAVVKIRKRKAQKSVLSKGHLNLKITKTVQKQRNLIMKKINYVEKTEIYNRLFERRS